jgi:hypothetical protein
MVLLQLEVQAQGVFQVGHQVCWDSADHASDAFDGDRSDLFGLSL